MNKDIKDACCILQKQIDKTKLQGFAFTSWRIQSASYIKLYFGENSEEYAFFTQRVFSDATYGIIEISEVEKSKSTILHLTNAIETLKVKGIYKHKQKRFISNISEGWLIFWAGCILAAFGITFSIGYWYGERADKSITAPIMPHDKTQYKENNTTDTTKE